MPTHGVLPDGEIEKAAEHGWVSAAAPFVDDQIQPASLDLRLSDKVFRVRASFLPGAGVKVAERLTRDLVMHEIDISRGAVLETGCVYLAPLQESVALPEFIHGAANPKSSTGRIDVFTRLSVDGATQFDHVPSGYQGPLWAEICPRTFSILVRPGDRLSQLRLRRGPTHPKHEMNFSIDLALKGPVGFRAKRHAGVIDLGRIGAYDPRDFWEPLAARGGTLVLDPGEFYIFASKENVLIPAEEAAEMAPIRPELGEFRAHYAGFFDPGFGIETPGKAVLEVRARDAPFILEDGQPVGKLVFEPLSGPAKRLYGESGINNYQGQGLKLSKHFSPW